MHSTALVAAPPVTERDWQRQVLDLADLLGWKCYHTWLSARSCPGFPDLVLVRSGRILFAELKSARGKVTPAQEEWLQILGTVENVEVYVWRPDDLEDVARTLGQGAQK